MRASIVSSSGSEPMNPKHPSSSVASLHWLFSLSLCPKSCSIVHAWVLDFTSCMCGKPHTLFLWDFSFCLIPDFLLCISWCLFHSLPFPSFFFSLCLDIFSEAVQEYSRAPYIQCPSRQRSQTTSALALSHYVHTAYTTPHPPPLPSWI